MKVFKGRPDKNLGLVVYKKYHGRKTARLEAIKLADEGRQPYLRKVGKIGAVLPYEIWARPKHNCKY